VEITAVAEAVKAAFEEADQLLSRGGNFRDGGPRQGDRRGGPRGGGKGFPGGERPFSSQEG